MGRSLATVPRIPSPSVSPHGHLEQETPHRDSPVDKYLEAFPVNITTDNSVDWTSVLALAEKYLLHSDHESTKDLTWKSRSAIRQAMETGIHGRWPVLSQAVYEENLDLIDRLLDLRIDPNACSRQHREQYRAPLAMCAFLPPEKSVVFAGKLILTGRARPTSYTVMAACQAGNLHFFKQLISIPRGVSLHLPLPEKLENRALVLLAEGRPGAIREQGDEEHREQIAIALLDGRKTFSFQSCQGADAEKLEEKRGTMFEVLPSDLADENYRHRLASFLRRSLV